MRKLPGYYPFTQIALYLRIFAAVQFSYLVVFVSSVNIAGSMSGCSLYPCAASSHFIVMRSLWLCLISFAIAPVAVSRGVRLSAATAGCVILAGTAD